MKPKFDTLAHWHMMGKNVRVRCFNGSVFDGVWDDWASELDNEPNGECITILTNNGGIPVEFIVDEIESMTLLAERS
ncbi:MAG: hypothetical protein LBT60_03445 [Oscillospiraceae bacterium]|jgi:hypothetical protein|nr:hypothetical protein [Oscillospiraceae bacterium]